MPITVNGTVVGAVGVSGSASANDAAVADAGARAVTP
ncbi:MAG: heme-binding protein [Gemmatirosa sp.]